MAAGNKRFADDGWAIWIEGDDTSTVYVSDWLNPKGKSFADLAVRIRGVRASRNFNVYIPFPVTPEEIEDISLHFQDTNVLRATFSSACIIDFMKNAHTSEAAYNGRTIDIVHISTTDFSVEPLASGSVLKLDLMPLQEYFDNDEVYFMFRMPHKSLDKIFAPQVNMGSTLERLRDLIMSPVISEKYGCSVRINESRQLPLEINRIGSFHRQKLKKAVVTLSINENYEINDSSCYRIRRMETDLYKDFAPKGFDCDDVITYQWNQTREADLQGHFSFYVNISHNAISRTSMLVYMILLMLLSILSEIVTGLFKLLFGINF